ncbi:hypothetical protein [Butyrivibrio sp. MB2005]|uniref:hypothetical protein n=1 Tax=Butyrivibrio sp. MB2005 TaxID=1280678 RepID=UPI000421CB73|nr:hypothetical protein [Butyrivibrio sp. MB2005]
MKGVSFNGLRSYTDLGLVLYSKTISPPVIRTTTVEIPGRDGNLDITEALTGRVTYEDREIIFAFRIPKPKKEWANVYSKVLNSIHGKKMDIILDDDPDYYYTGRVAVDEFSTNRNLSEIVVKCLVSPKKTYKTGIKQTVAVSGTKAITLKNDGLPVVPDITTDKEMDVTFSGKTYHLSPGKNRVFDILLPQGSTSLTFNGTGNVTVEYKVQSL